MLIATANNVIAAINTQPSIPAQSSAIGAQVVEFSIPAGNLDDALDYFSEQSGLQTIYALPLIADKKITAISGTLLPSVVLDHLVKGTGLRWKYVNGNTVLFTANNTPPLEQPAPLTTDLSSEQPTGLQDILVIGDPRRILSQSTITTFGFDKSLLETPRSLSVISEETIELFGLSAVEDLLRVVPAVYTTTRFGIQGAIDVRNVSADTYVRGMKRLNLQGHGRSVLGATDTIEIVRGPPSPLYGMGKVGGYTNVIPKSGRARMGGYLSRPQMFTQLILGEYNRQEISFGVGGPMSPAAKTGGYYLYGLLEDSDTYTRDVGVGQIVLQGAISIEDFLGPFRLEGGVNYQRSSTSGALLNRFNQDVVDYNLYVQGQPLVNLDSNGNGAIGYLEMHNESPVLGELAAGNQPLIQRWAWPLNEQGQPLPIDEFPRVAGIPQSLYDYLVANPEADPGGFLRAQGVGGPVPISGYVPSGFALDPRTVGYTQLDPRRAGAFEREVRADFTLAFFDLIYETDPNFTVKNQLFFDSMDQYKLSEQPGGGKQDVQVIENKLTLTRRLSNASDWLQIEALASLNFRNTRATGYRYVGDQGSHRTDVMSGIGAMTPNTTFVHPFDNPIVEADGAPWYSNYRSEYWELGFGGMFDIHLGEKTNVLLGARVDRSRAKNIDNSGTLDPFAGTSSNPGVVRELDVSARAYDADTSWSLSLSHQLPYKIRPYATVAESSLTLESNNNRMPNSVINNGHIGNARLYEVGVKSNLLDDRLFFSIARYKQSRTDITEDNYFALQSADVSATTTRGWESELKWVPYPSMFLSLYGVWQETLFTPNSSENILVNARTLGFEDVKDAEGNIIFPAEAFLYGGRSFLILPAGLADFVVKQGNPQTQFGLSAQYQLPNKIGFTFSGNYFSSVYTGRLQQVKLPTSQVYNLGVFFDAGNWQFKVDINNLFNERYFRPRTGDNLGETLVSAMPERHWTATLKINL